MSVDPSSALPLSTDGERFLPGRMFGEIELEHLHRYNFARQFVHGKAVLDIACGEGYGSALLARDARRVLGVDLSDAVIEHARQKYAFSNLEFLSGSCSAIPMEAGAIDVVVSFETIEHHAEHERMIGEIKRVLRPDGLLLISTPDRQEYADKRSLRNPFHVKELYKEELEALLRSHFGSVSLFGQRVLLGSVLLGPKPQRIKVYRHEERAGAGLSEFSPMYWVAVASNGKLPAIELSVYEQSLTDIWSTLERQRNADVLNLIRAIALPNSQRLRSHLESDWYLREHADVAAAGVDPLEHWMNSGADEGRLPSTDLSSLLDEVLQERVEASGRQRGEPDGQKSQVPEDVAARISSSAKEMEEHRVLLHAEISRVERETNARLQSLSSEFIGRQDGFVAELARQQESFTTERAELLSILRQREEREPQWRREWDAFQGRLQELERRWESTLHRVHRESSERLELARREAKEGQAALQEEVIRVKRDADQELESLIQQLADRERVAAEQLARQRAALEAEHAHGAKVADKRLSETISEHVGREERLQERLDAVQKALKEESEAQRQALKERERVLIEQQAGFDARLAEILADYDRREGELRQQLFLAYDRFAASTVQDRALVRAQQLALTNLKKNLETLETSMGWRLAAPIRAIAAVFGSRSRLPKIDSETVQTCPPSLPES